MIFKTLKANYMKEHKITVQIFVDILKIIALIVTLFPYQYHKNSTLLIVFKDNSNILSCRKNINPALSKINISYILSLPIPHILTPTNTQ